MGSFHRLDISLRNRPIISYKPKRREPSWRPLPMQLYPMVPVKSNEPRVKKGSRFCIGRSQAGPGGF